MPRPRTLGERTPFHRRNPGRTLPTPHHAHRPKIPSRPCCEKGTGRQIRPEQPKARRCGVCGEGRRRSGTKLGFSIVIGLALTRLVPNPSETPRKPRAIFRSARKPRVRQVQQKAFGLSIRRYAFDELLKGGSTPTRIVAAIARLESDC
jgi:hypothetical protein